MTAETPTRTPTVFDSTQQQVGEQYARALLQLGQANGKTDELLNNLGWFAGIIREMPKLAGLLESPRVSLADKERVLIRALGEHVTREFANFTRLLVRKGRFDCLPAIQAAAVRLRDEVSGRVRGVVTVAHPVSDQAVAGLAANLGKRLGREVLLTSEVDAAIIGGVVVRVGDTVYDASVRNRLKQLRTRAAKNAADAIREQLGRFAS
jgi:F-type H+-transporting ATPase subunit delta